MNGFVLILAIAKWT